MGGSRHILRARTAESARPGGRQESSIGPLTDLRGLTPGVLTHGTEDALPEGALAKQLAEGKPAAGEARHRSHRPRHPPRARRGPQEAGPVPEAGHKVVLIIGDYTARVGDPSGRDSRGRCSRPEEIDANAKTFKDQAFKVLDRDTHRGPLQQRVARHAGRRALHPGRPGDGRAAAGARRLHASGWRRTSRSPCSSCSTRSCRATTRSRSAPTSSSGGPTRSSTCCFGRDVQRAHGQPEQSVITMPILPGLDGERRMSKSLGNYVGVTDAPEEMFGKLMSIPDSVDAHLLRAAAGRRARPAGPPSRPSALWRAGSSTASTARAPARAPRRRFDRVHVQGEVAGGHARGVARRRPGTTCTCPR